MARLGRGFPAKALIRRLSVVDIEVVFDASSNSGYQTAQSSYSWSHTCSGNNRYLTVGISMLSVGGSSVSSITYNGVSLSLIKAQASVSGAVRAELWGLAVPASGPHTITVTLSASLDSIGGAVSFANVVQATSTEAANSATATNVGAADATVDVTTISNKAWVVDIVATDDTSITVGAGQTSRNNVTGTLGSGAMSTEGPKTPAGAVTMSWTNVAALATWSIASVAIIPLSASKSLSAGAGSFVLTGTAAGVLVARKVAAAAGSYALTGTAATLQINRPIVAGAGSYALTGAAASLLHAWKLPAGAGSYTFTGTAASLIHSWRLSAAAGAYNLTGTAATLQINRPIVAGAGSYLLTGSDATLTVTSSTKVLAAGAGSFALTGTAATLAHAWRTAAAAGSYALTGTAATLLHGLKVAAAGGSYVLTGTAASLISTSAVAGKSRALRNVQRAMGLSGLASEAEYHRVAYLQERQVKLAALAEIRAKIAEAKRLEERQEEETRLAAEPQLRGPKTAAHNAAFIRTPNPFIEAQRVQFAGIVREEVARLKEAEYREADDLRRLEENHARIMAEIEDDEDVLILVMATM